MHLENWGGCGKKIIQIPSVSHLKYDRFKQNIVHDNFIGQTLKGRFSNSNDSDYFLNIINLCSYLTENYEEECFIYCW